jgi:hypothetical protein
MATSNSNTPIGLLHNSSVITPDDGASGNSVVCDNARVCEVAWNVSAQPSDSPEPSFVDISYQ